MRLAKERTTRVTTHVRLAIYEGREKEPLHAFVPSVFDAEKSYSVYVNR